jgi:hypothetical protein
MVTNKDQNIPIACTMDGRAFVDIDKNVCKVF